MWWRQSWFSLNGTMGIQGKKGALSYATQLLNTNQPIRAPRWPPPSSASLGVSMAATIWPVSASRPRCILRQDRRDLLPCFSTSHSPGPQSLRPVLSTKEVHGVGVTAQLWPGHLQRLGPAAQGGMVRNREIEP